MNIFDEQMFNPNYFNIDYYRQVKHASYEKEQHERVVEAIHSFTYMMDQVSGMDAEHQNQTFYCCLLEYARRNGWG